MAEFLSAPYPVFLRLNTSPVPQSAWLESDVGIGQPREGTEADKIRDNFR
jgi:hypothetical protein